MIENEYSSLTKEEAIALLKQLGENGGVAVLPSALLARLIELGVPFTVKEGETIDEFFERAKLHAQQIVGSLPPMPNWLEYQFQRPYFEARTCLLIGLYGAATTQAAILLERVLKWTAYCVHATAERVPSDHWSTLEQNMQFGAAVGYAKSWGLVNKDLSNRLERFRVEIRNVQGHLLIAKATAGIELPHSSVVDFSDRTVTAEQSINAHENPTISAMAKEKLDELRALDVFLFMHSCLELLFDGMQRQISARRTAKAS